jgi:hypothetical protein
MSLVFVDENFLSGVEDLDEAVVTFFLLVDGLVQRLVVSDSFSKIGDDLVNVRESNVIRTKKESKEIIFSLIHYSKSPFKQHLQKNRLMSM